MINTVAKCVIHTVAKRVVNTTVKCVINTTAKCVVIRFTVYLVKIAYGSNMILQTKLNSLQSELESLRDTSLHQKKRVTDMMVSLLKDLSDIGAVIGGSAAANKVTE